MAPGGGSVLVVGAGPGPGVGTSARIRVILLRVGLGFGAVVVVVVVERDAGVRVEPIPGADPSGGGCWVGSSGGGGTNGVVGWRVGIGIFCKEPHIFSPSTFVVVEMYIEMQIA